MKSPKGEKPHLLNRLNHKSLFKDEVCLSLVVCLAGNTLHAVDHPLKGLKCCLYLSQVFTPENWAYLRSWRRHLPDFSWWVLRQSMGIFKDGLRGSFCVVKVQ